MTSFHKARPLAAALFFGGALLAAVSAQAVMNPPIRMTHGIEYMSGGVGQDEAELMETVSPRWPATLEFAVKDRKHADFAADVHVTVHNATGVALLDDVVSHGPYLVARLDPGDYVVDAELQGRKLEQKLHVPAGGPAKAVFEWPAGTDMAARAKTTASPS